MLKDGTEKDQAFNLRNGGNRSLVELLCHPGNEFCKALPIRSRGFCRLARRHLSCHSPDGRGKSLSRPRDCIWARLHDL